MRGLRPTAETVFGISTALTGIGILTVALAPLAMPILILTIASLLPLVVIGAAVALPIGLIAGLVLVIRALARRRRRSDRRGDLPGPRPLPAGPRSPRRA